MCVPADSGYLPIPYASTPAARLTGPASGPPAMLGSDAECSADIDDAAGGCATIGADAEDGERRRASYAIGLVDRGGEIAYAV